MKKTESKIALTSLLIGIFNPVVCTLVLFFSNLTGLIIVMIGVPMVGILLGVIGLFLPERKRVASVVGIVLNLPPIVLILGLLALFQSSETFGIWR